MLFRSRRGSKGIALLDESSGFPRLHYVFDVSDTGVRRNSRDPEVWKLGPDLVQPVSEMLAATYGISGERVSQQLADVAGKLVADYWDNNSGDILAIVDGSLLMDYDEAGVEMQFKSAAAISVTYTLLERCGYEPTGWFDKDDFQAILNRSTIHCRIWNSIPNTSKTSTSMSWIVALRQTPSFTITPTSANAYSMLFKSA